MRRRADPPPRRPVRGAPWAGGGAPLPPRPWPGGGGAPRRPAGGGSSASAGRRRSAMATSSKMEAVGGCGGDGWSSPLPLLPCFPASARGCWGSNPWWGRRRMALARHHAESKGRWRPSRFWRTPAGRRCGGKRHPSPGVAGAGGLKLARLL
jgi:hypothetical protein